jgi:4-amino-4-deoxy-L-arabinose transferase-like glycosyltransferase
MMVKSDKKFLEIAAVIVVLALVLRAAWGATVPVIPISDSRAYDILARALVEHGSYSWGRNQLTAYWPPGTSAVYAALYAVFGHDFIPTVVLNVFLSTAIVVLTIALASMLFDRKTGLVAGFLMAIWPSELAYVTILASELPFTFLILIGCTLWLARGAPNLTRAGASGLMFGAASYFRPIGLLLPIVLWLKDAFEWRKLRAGLPTMLASLIVIGITIAPWTIRNAQVFGHFVLMSTSDGVNLWMGNNPHSTGSYLPVPATVRGLSEYDQNKILSEDALLYISEHPVVFVSGTLKKAALLHLTETIAITWNTEGIKERFGENTLFPLKLVTQGFWTGVLLFAFAGIVVLMRRFGFFPALAHPVLLIWIYFTGVYSIFVVEDRYHFPCHPFIAMLAAVAILEAGGAVRRFLSKRNTMPADAA